MLLDYRDPKISLDPMKTSELEKQKNSKAF